MSNTQAPNGFSQLNLYNGASPNYAMTTRQIAYDNSHSIGTGDPVEELNTGYIDIASGSTTTILGIFLGCEYTDSIRGKVWSRSWNHPSTAVAGTVQALVCNDPNAQFLVQAGGSTTAIGLADIGANAYFGGAGAPNTAGSSVAYLDQTTINTTNTLAFRIMGLGQSPNNDNTSGYNWVIVKMNNQAYNTTTGL